MEQITLVWEIDALSDFHDLAQWYGQRMGAGAKKKFTEGIIKLTEQIKLIPTSGKREYIDLHTNTTYQSRISHRYYKIIYYREDNTIYIARIWACRQEIKTTDHDTY